MATFNLTISYPDGEGPRILAALKARMAATTGENPNPTSAEAIEWLRRSIAAELRRAVRDHEGEVARNSVADTNIS